MHDEVTRLGSDSEREKKSGISNFSTPVHYSFMRCARVYRAFSWHPPVNANYRGNQRPRKASVLAVRTHVWTVAPWWLHTCGQKTLSL